MFQRILTGPNVYENPRGDLNVEKIERKQVFYPYKKKDKIQDTIRVHVKMNKLNYVDWCPGLSTISGLFRFSLAFVYTIYHFALSKLTKDKDHYHYQESGIGFWNMFRGLVAAIPVVNLYWIYYDLDNKKWIIRHTMDNLPEFPAYSHNTEIARTLTHTPSVVRFNETENVTANAIAATGSC